eukprot:1809284-Rhodomonas_salina.2
MHRASGSMRLAGTSLSSSSLLMRAMLAVSRSPAAVAPYLTSVPHVFPRMIGELVVLGSRGSLTLVPDHRQIGVNCGILSHVSTAMAQQDHRYWGQL